MSEEMWTAVPQGEQTAETQLKVSAKQGHIALMPQHWKHRKKLRNILMESVSQDSVKAHGICCHQKRGMRGDSLGSVSCNN